MTNAEIEMEAAQAAFKIALANVQRSKSNKNRVAYGEASARIEAARVALFAERDANERTELRNRRLAIVAPRRALLACQSAFNF